jgi:sulfate transport system ATP-binding protein
MLIDQERPASIDLSETPVLPLAPTPLPPEPKAEARLAAPAAAVSIKDVSKRFGRYPALNGVSLDIAPGELLALLGPSGSGKTTLLRLIAGLEFPDVGVIDFAGRDMTFVKAAARGIGFVFQQYALFKHMTVARNVAFGLDVKRGGERLSRKEKMERVQALLKLVELDGLGGRHPAQLSGGQRQRVALARALAVSPKVLLLDEPFGALDATVRKTLRRELRRIHDATGVITVFVTHDQEEALELADRVALLNHGRIEQVGSPREVTAHPASPFAAGFVGEANRLDGEVRSGVFHALGAALPAPEIADGKALAFVQPEGFAAAAPGEPAIRATIRRATPKGLVTALDAETADGQPLHINVLQTDAMAAAQPGETLRLALKAGQVFSIV